jgi:hypothetical protein
MRSEALGDWVLAMVYTLFDFGLVHENNTVSWLYQAGCGNSGRRALSLKLLINRRLEP